MPKIFNLRILSLIYLEKNNYENEKWYFLGLSTCELWMQVGFDSFFFGRIDYQDRDKRKKEKSLEVIWQGSKSLGSSSQVAINHFLPFNICIAVFVFLCD